MRILIKLYNFLFKEESKNSCKKAMISSHRTFEYFVIIPFIEKSDILSETNIKFDWLKKNIPVFDWKFDEAGGWYDKELKEWMIKYRFEYEEDYILFRMTWE